MTLEIVVDANAAESFLYEALQEATLPQGTQLRRQRLDLGDVQIRLGDLNVLIERKTWSDWKQSITDGRYKEQKARFLGSCAQSTKLIYLIEGSLRRFDGKTDHMENKALNAAVIKTQLRDDIHVLRSCDAKDSADTLIYYAQQLAAGGLDPASAKKGVAGASYKRKRDNLEDPKDLSREMLTIIPGMSDEKARAVLDSYPSFRVLRKASVSDLAKVRCGGGDGKAARQLGPAVAKRISALFE